MRRLPRLKVPCDDAGNPMGCRRSARYIRGLRFAARYTSTALLLTVLAGSVNEAHAKCNPQDIGCPGPTHPPPPPPPPDPNSVSLLAIEVTQAIQDLDNHVTLIADKDTWVRVYLQKATGPSRGVTAKLQWTVNGYSNTISPERGIIVDAISDDALSDMTTLRKDWSRSLNFKLPINATYAGAVTLKLMSVSKADSGSTSIYCANCDLTQTPVTFYNEPPLRVRVIGLTYGFQQAPTSPLNIAIPRPIDYDLLKSWLSRAYPVPQVDFSKTTAPLGFKPKFNNGTEDCSKANALVSKIRGNDIHLNVDPRTHYYGLVSDAGGFMRGCATIPSKPDPSTVASGPTGPKGYGDTDGSYGDWYGGHELAHTLGRHHPGFCLDNDKDDPNWPYPNGQINNYGYAGLDVGDPDPDHYVPREVLWTAFDIMTYCDQPQWLSAYTYEGVRQRLLDEDPGFQTQAVLLAAASRGGVDSIAQRVIGPPQPQINLLTGPMVHVVALVNLTRDTGTIEYVDPVQRAAPQVDATDRAALVVRDGSGRKLSRTPVALRETTDIPSGEDQTALVDAAVPFNPAMAEIELELDQVVLARYRNATTSPKAASALQLFSAISIAPPGAAAETGPILNWTPPRVAAGTVTYTVETSDDGNTWRTIAIGLTEPGLMLTEDQASARMVRVIASNGFRSAAPVMINLRK
jgi:hypothetical protein